MKKLTKFLIFLLIGAALLVSAVGLGFWNELKNGTEASEKSELHRWLAVNARLEEVEDALEAWWEKDTKQETNTTVEDATEAVTHTVTEAQTAPHDTVETETADDTTAVTESESAPRETAEGGYVIRTHQGGIGIFNAQDTLVEQINVAVMTLPPTDREALAAGISAETLEEARRIIDKLA